MEDKNLKSRASKALENYDSRVGRTCSRGLELDNIWLQYALNRYVQKHSFLSPFSCPDSADFKETVNYFLIGILTCEKETVLHGGNNLLIGLL